MDKSTKIYEISKLTWERIFLKMEIRSSCKEKTEFYLERFDDVKRDAYECVVGVTSLQKVPLPYEKYADDVYYFCINMSAVNGRMFLDNGTWRIVAKTAEEEQVCYVSHEVGYDFGQVSRIFRYGNKYAYTVSFNTIIEEERYLWFVMESYFMITNHRWKKRHYVQEANTLANKFKNFAKTVVICLIRLFYQFWEHIFPKNGNKVLLMSETKDYLTGNLLAIDEEIKRSGLDKTLKVAYSFRKTVGNHSSILSWVSTVYKIAQQDYIFVDDYVPIFGFLKLNKRTKLIQVWHAGEGFKAVGYCRFGKEGTPYPAESCHKQYDYALTGSKKLVKVFAEVFGIEEDAFLPVGMPRLDGFLDEEKIENFRKNFYDAHPNLAGKKIILFAPTYRGAGQKTAYYDYSWIDLEEIYDFCDSEYVFMIKMHPFIKKRIEIPEGLQDRIVDFTEYPNINELYYVTDILITDYSSNYFEYSLMKRPMLFFTPDREVYELSRGVHRGVKESAPGKVCDTFEDLMDSLRKEDYEYEKVIQFVEDNFANYDGKATKKALEQVLNMKE